MHRPFAQVLSMPFDGWRKSDFYRVVKSVFALVYILLYMYPIFGIIASLVHRSQRGKCGLFSSTMALGITSDSCLHFRSRRRRRGRGS